MKKLSFFCFLLVSTAAMAQAPDALSYQATVRNASNNLVQNKNVASRFSILKGSVSGTVVYSETQVQSTNANGLLTSKIGNGTVETGSFSNINWGADTYFVKTETDPNGGTNYSIVGTTQLLSVPYALYAKNSGSSTPGPQGLQGPKGDKGDTGNAGVKGDTGAQGIPGVKGETGVAGAKGDTGAQGIPGLKGDTGVAGAKGDTGAQGIPGVKGETGVQGIPGVKGDAGVAGVKGDTGAQGIPGVKGDAGTAGDKGDKGDKGDAGVGFANGTGGAQIYLTSSSAPYAAQSPVAINGDITINTSGTATIANAKVTTEKINDGAVTVAKLSASGTKDSSTFLRGDGTWAAPAGGGSGSMAIVTVNGATTLNNVNQMIYITGAYTVTLPANPSTGLMIYISTENKNAVLDPGTKRFRQNGQDYPASKITEFGKDNTANGNSIGMILIYNGSKWFSY